MHRYMDVWLHPQCTGSLCVGIPLFLRMCVFGRVLSTELTLLQNSFIPPAIFFSGCHIPFCSVHLVSMELICLCLCPPVYSMGCSVGGLERLHHLFLPGRRRPVQGEIFKVAVRFFLQVFHHASVSQWGGFVCTMMNVLFSPRSWLKTGEGAKPDFNDCVLLG